MHVPLAWVARVIHVLVLHLAPGEQVRILEKTLEAVKDVEAEQWVVLGDFNSQRLGVGTAEREKRKPPFLTQSAAFSPPSASLRSLARRALPFPPAAVHLTLIGPRSPLTLCVILQHVGAGPPFPHVARSLVDTKL